MTMTKMVADYARRPKQAAEADGLNDVLSGITFVAISGMWYANSRLTETIRGDAFSRSRDFQGAAAVFVLAVIAMFAIILSSKRCIQTLREQFVYPRLGYVAQPTSPTLRQKQITMILSLVSTVVLARIGMHRIESGQSIAIINSGMLPALLGGLGGGIYFYQFLRLGFVRHLVLGLIVVVSASLLPLAKLDDVLAIRCLTVFWGISSIVAGVVTFSRLRRTPPITTAEDEAE